MKKIIGLLLILSSFKVSSQNHWIRIEVDVKDILNPSCNLNENIR